MQSKIPKYKEKHDWENDGVEEGQNCIFISRVKIKKESMKGQEELSRTNMI